MRRSPAARIANALATSVLVLCIVAFGVFALGPRTGEYRTVTVLTGSMSPRIEPGDVVVLVPKPAADVEVGDVLTFRAPTGDRQVVTHRVIEVTRDASGAPTIRTKGDANAGADPWIARVDDRQVWEQRAVVPGAGTAIRALRGPAVQAVTSWGALGAFVLFGLASIWGVGRGGRGDDVSADDLEGADDLLGAGGLVGAGAA